MKKNNLQQKIYNYFYKKGYNGKYLDIRYNEFLKFLKQSLIIIIFLFLIIDFFILLNIKDINFLKKIDETDKKYFKFQSNLYENDDIIISIANICSLMDTEYKKIKCVNNFVKEFYYYDTHDNEIRIIRTPNNIINKGGCCRDYSIFYSSIFNLMDLKNEFIFENNFGERHVYLEIYGKNNYIIDQQFLIIKNKKYINN
ncbi:MAG: transglutaminase-like domain-containing protein [Promethearchaeia archaeon]